MKMFLLGLTLFAVGWLSAAILTAMFYETMYTLSLGIAAVGALLLMIDGFRALHKWSNDQIAKRDQTHV